MKLILKTFQIFLIGIILIVVGGYDCVEESNFRYNKGLTTDNFLNSFSSHRRNKRDENLIQPALNHRYENFDINKNCGGVFKSFQTIIYSPNYSPSQFYLPNLICDYKIESPIKCSNQFHIQFLDFQLETSSNCEKDFLHIGNELLCGQIIGIKRYNTTDGILRLRFQTDNNNQNKGFKLLITRQPCGNDYRELNKKDYKGTNNDNDNNVKDSIISAGFETTTANLIRLNDKLPENIILPSFKDGHIFQTYRHQENVDKFNNKQYLRPTLDGSDINGYLPSGWPRFYHTGMSLAPTNQLPDNPALNNNLSPSLICYPADSQKQPKFPNYLPPQFPYYPVQELPQIPLSSNLFRNQVTTQFNPVNNHHYFSNFTSDEPKYIESQVAPWLSENIPQCCVNIFRQKHFYLSSPGFPMSTNYPIDCLYYIEKFSSNICRLKIKFKFFKLGKQTRIGGIEYSNIQVPQVICLEDFIEIDGQRLCGCRTGLVYTSQWGFGAKVIRLRLGGNEIEPNIGFILDIFQEDCPYRYQRNPRDIKESIYLQPKAILETNSTIRTSVYVPYIDKINDEINSDKQQQINTAEGPSSQFFFVANHQQNHCIFTPTDYFRLTIDSLWILKPICAARRYTI